MILMLVGLVAITLVIDQTLAQRQLNAFRAALREIEGTRTRDFENAQPAAHSRCLVVLLEYRAVLESANQYRRITEAQKATSVRTMDQIDRQIIRLKKATTRGVETRLAAEYAHHAPAA